MTKPINTDAIAKATGKSWEQWVDEIEAAGGRSMTHTELARKLYDELDGTIDNHGWRRYWKDLLIEVKKTLR